MKISITEKITKYNQSGKKLKAKGLAIHSTANVGATAMNHYNYFNNGVRWANCHYFVDWLDKDYIVRLVKESNQAWHLGGPKGNGSYIGIEMCEAKNSNDFNKVWNRTVSLAVDILKRYNWTVKNIISHNEHSKNTSESDHTDPIGYFKRYGKTWNDFIKDVEKELKGEVKEEVKITPDTINSDTYTIKKGDTFYSIAKELNTTVDNLQNLNPNIDAKALKIGQKINIKKIENKTNDKIHIVKSGDTLWGIARIYNTTVSNLFKLNPNVKSTSLKIGEKIRVNGEILKDKIILPNVVLKKGDKGENVKILQKYLNQLYFNVGVVDGSYGTKTENAVRRFQSVYCNPSDGIYGPKTKIKMEYLLNK